MYNLPFRKKKKIIIFFLFVADYKIPSVFPFPLLLQSELSPVKLQCEGGKSVVEETCKINFFFFFCSFSKSTPSLNSIINKKTKLTDMELSYPVVILPVS